jgi:dinuclear metal center YbgI/SA1388 family protein
MGIMKIKDVVKLLEVIAPLNYQESYDNSGLLIGNEEIEVKAILCTLDVTPLIIEEAISLGANLIVSHHPIFFEPLRKLTGNTDVEKTIILAIRNDIAIYAAHTNLDNSIQGVNKTICDKIGLKDCKILLPKEDYLVKVVTFVPADHAQKVRDALFASGAGHIGNYDSCSFNLTGQGTFRAGENTNPFAGEKGKFHTENEVRIEFIVQKDRLTQVIDELKKTHPYEEVAFDVYPLQNEYKGAGCGMVGNLERGLDINEFLDLLKSTFNLPVIRYSGRVLNKIRRVALCGGSGAFLLNHAIREKSDAFLTSDIKYHQFFDLHEKILLCDIGHYESEQFTKDFFYLLLNKKSSTFAVHLSKVVTNPIKYYL